ncbi:MAG: ribosome biogenesis GTP-binding protein YsxC [Alphaproteobacteria bacterium]|nr:ribosome biogenesis GTP-binding protein YsxC [Alphaproteobacteria bacterium]MBL0717870.1 ribosome biogenesis GTP-binding protein YsxC [Alphaproteobacteria bacterium]
MRDYKFLGSFREDNHPSHLPIFPATVWIGRSNSGKSSLINAVSGKNRLAFTSKLPGRTRDIVYFGDKNSYYIDLPGYGFAKAGDSHKDFWEKSLSSFILKNDCISMIFLLIDSRRSFQPLDIEMLDWLELNDLPYQVILTKIDKLKLKELERVKKEIESLYKLKREVLISSSKTKKGITEIRYAIEDNNNLFFTNRHQ